MAHRRRELPDGQCARDSATEEGCGVAALRRAWRGSDDRLQAEAIRLLVGVVASVACLTVVIAHSNPTASPPIRALIGPRLEVTPSDRGSVATGTPAAAIDAWFRAIEMGRVERAFALTSPLMVARVGEKQLRDAFKRARHTAGMPIVEGTFFAGPRAFSHVAIVVANPSLGALQVADTQTVWLVRAAGHWLIANATRVPGLSSAIGSQRSAFG